MSHVAAGILGYLGSMPANRLDTAVVRAPWRGQINAHFNTPIGGVVALGNAIAGGSDGVFAVLHGRIDNIADLAGSLGVPSEPIAVVLASYRRHGDEFGRQF